MTDGQTEFAEGRPDLETVKEMRRNHPSGWLELSKDPARALLIDALLDAPPGYEFSPTEISPRAGVSDQSVRNHIDILVDRGLVEEIDASRYRLNDTSRIMTELEHLNSAVAAVRSGAATKKIETVDPDEMMDNSQRDASNDDLFDIPPTEKSGAMNAD